MWALPLPPLPVDGGWSTLSIVDEARKININQLVGPNGQVNQQFAQTITTLLTILGIDPTTIVPSLIDWLDPDSVETPGGAESDYYLRLVPPYEARNGPMPTIGDLRLVRGIDEPTFMRLKNFITTTPSVRININTAPPEVMMAVAPQLAQTPVGAQFHPRGAHRASFQQHDRGQRVTGSLQPVQPRCRQSFPPPATTSW